MSAKITLIGFYNYDPTLFDGLTLPDGIEKDLVVDEILERSGEFESLYSNPDFVKNRITMWGRKHYRTFDKWIKALNIEYDPLYNYDRFEEYTDSHVGNELLSGNRSDTYQNAQSAENDTKRANNSIINELSKDSSNESGNALEGSIKSGESSDKTSGSSNNIENIRSSNNGIENSIDSVESSEHSGSSSNGVTAKLDNSNVVSNSHSVDDIKPVEQTTTKEHKVAAYDSNTYQPSAQDTDSNVVNVNGKDENSTDSITGTNGNSQEIANSTGSEDKSGNNNSSSNKMSENIESSDKISGNAQSSDSHHEDSEGFNNVKSDVRNTDNDRNASSFTADNGSEKNESKYSDVHAGHELYNDNKLLKDETKHNAHLYGNIGIVSSQKMLADELEIQRFNIYTQIADLFVQDFCIMLY